MWLFLLFFTIVDAFSRFTWIYPLKLKSHTLSTFQNFKIIKLKLPNLMVVNCVPLPNFLMIKVSHLTHIIKMDQLKECIGTLLKLVGPCFLVLKCLSFWDHVFHTATYLINRMTASTIENFSLASLIKLANKVGIVYTTKFKKINS
jgi:hypothetical protein